MNFLQAAAASNLNLGNFDFANYSRIFAANNPKVAGEITAVQQLLLFQQHFQQQVLLQLQAQQQQPNKDSTNFEAEDEEDTEEEDDEEEALDLSQRSGPPPQRSLVSRPAPVKKQQQKRKISPILSAAVDKDNEEPLYGRRLQAKQRSLIVSELLEQSIYPSKAAIEQFFADHGRFFESCKQVQTKLRRYRQQMKPKSGEVEAQLMMAKQDRQQSSSMQ